MGHLEVKPEIFRTLIFLEKLPKDFGTDAFVETLSLSAPQC